MGYYSCDDSSETLYGAWGSEECEENATGYAAATSLVGVIGTFNSGCTRIELPILNQAPGGGLALVSPFNLAPCLTRKVFGCARGEPAKYAPSGRRTYARVSANDTIQGAGLALFARQRGWRRVFVLTEGDSYGRMVAHGFRGAARHLGLNVVGHRAWDPNARNYLRLMHVIGETRPDAIVLAGIIDFNGGHLIKEKVAVLGGNGGPVKLLASDGFLTPNTFADAGASAKGMFAAFPGRSVGGLPSRGRKFVADFRERFRARKVSPHVPASAQIAALYLKAIAASDGSRTGVLDALFSLRVERGLIGSFSIDAYGDPTPAPVTISRAGQRRFTTFGIVKPGRRLVDAAFTRLG